jgi:predicted nucleic acid-binding protein
MSSIDISRRPTFIDTNILIYSIDWRDEEKLVKARELLHMLERDGAPVVSTQVLMEFYNAATSKLKIEQFNARRLVELYSNMTVVVIDSALVKRAIDVSILHRISFWDALIISSAEQAGCPILFTEDLNSGQIINGVKIVNPFLE